MGTLHFEAAVVPVRTISLHELAETFFRYNSLHPKTEHGINMAFRRYAEIRPNSDTSSIDLQSLLVFQDYLTAIYDRNYINRLIKFIRQVFRWGVRAVH